MKKVAVYFFAFLLCLVAVSSSAWGQAEAVYQRAVTSYREGDFATARREAERLSREFGAGKWSEEVEFILAATQSDYTLGQSQLLKFIQDHPQSKFTSKAHLILAENFFLKGDLDTAYFNFNKIRDNYSSSAEVGEAVRRGAACLLAQKRDEEARSYVISFLAEHPNDSLAPELRELVADSLMEKGDFREALTAYEEIPAKHPKSNAARRVFLKIAELYKLNGATDKATETYRILIRQFPLSEEAELAKKRAAEQP